MPQLLYRVRYSINSLGIHPSLLGWSHSYSDDAATITLRLPIDANDFTARDFETDLPRVPSATHASTFTDPSIDGRTASVHLFVVEAVFEAPLGGNVRRQ